MTSNRKHPDNVNNDYNGWGTRHIQALLIFTCFTVAYFVRTSMSVAVIAMTDLSNKGIIQIFEWPKQTQDYLLSSFYFGYMLMQIPGGRLAYMYGGKRMIAISLTADGVLSFVLPNAAKIWGWKAVSVCRILQGLSQGCIVPSIHTLIGKWAPLSERNRIGNFIYTGYNLGTVSAMLVSGKLAASYFGWPLIFYVGGSLSLSAACLWMLLGAEAPSTHPRISSEEKQYIETSLVQAHKEKPKTTPWKAIFTSIPLAALLTVHIGAVWGSMLMLTETPSFLKMALGINVENSGLLTALSYTCSLICTIVVSALADTAINKNICSTTTVRKVASTLGTWGAGLAMMILTFIPQGQVTIGIIFIIFIVCLDSINCLGYMLNHIDLSPNFAGLLISFTNCCAAGFANFAPITAGLILQDSTDITRWRTVFFIAAGVYFLSNLVFLVFGSGERQHWDSTDIETNEENEEAVKEKLVMETTTKT